MFAIRSDERRDVWAGFVTLFGLISGHAILETARDALFLAKVPATHLPWVFLLTAAMSFGAVRFQGLFSGRGAARTALSAWTFGAGVVTFAFFVLGSRLGSAGLYALYVWSGLVTTLSLVHFWTLVGGLFSVTQAKRLYGLIGAGSVFGAIAGSGAASALAKVMPAQRLLLVSSVCFAVTSAMPLLFQASSRKAFVEPASTPTLASNVQYIRDSLYARRVVVMLLLSTVCLTVSDFLFKLMVARLVPASELGAFLGTVYFAINLTSLLCQLVLVNVVLKRTSLGLALAILPAFLALGGLGIAASGGLVAVLALKGADGSLRYSLHRTASELLFMPFSDEARQRVKGFMDVVGQRGGQIVASIGLLVFLGSRATPTMLSFGLVVLCLAWVASALALREPYVELFRARLKQGRMTRIEEFPQLDVASLETLVATLDSQLDNEVIAALQVLEREKKVHLVPALILYHPSESVVELALAIFTRTERKNVVHVIDRVLDHPSPRVRGAAIAARSVLTPDAEVLFERLRTESSAEVATTITVNLIASGDISGAEAAKRLEELLMHGTAKTKIALAEAIAGRGAEGFDDVLVGLSADRVVDVRRAAVAAMTRLVRPVFVPALIERLSEEATRTEAHEALAAHGPAALDGLRRALEAADTAPTLRWRIPHAMTFFEPNAAGDALLRWLPKEGDGGVRFQIIRALERLVRRTPELPLDKITLQNAIDETLTWAFGLLDSRLDLVRGGREVQSRRTKGHELLAATLVDKEKNTIERLFRLLDLAHPREDFGQIHRGLHGTRDERATSIELIDNVLVDPLRAAVRGLVDDLPDEERLRQSGKYHSPLGLDYAALLAHLRNNESDALRDIADFHFTELHESGSLAQEAV
ncbi:transporter, putative [Labilithrix luteola]|uniref:Transporter, putative n=1 Tax=Labilithrix luteola TaxID=1391654 RepID=A0A0K1PWA8_9BACT|nr:transporter, putative [Labilithrix luteola]